jgi:aryl-alcohol dehydrogenase-like predicted oxidoreductase
MVASPPPPAFLDDLGCATWSEALLRWTLSHPEVTSVLVATANVTHFRENMKAANRGALGVAECAAISRHAKSISGVGNG